MSIFFAQNFLFIFHTYNYNLIFSYCFKSICFYITKNLQLNVYRNVCFSFLSKNTQF